MDEPDAADGAVTALSRSSVASLNDGHDDTADVFDVYSADCSTARSIPSRSDKSARRPVSSSPYVALSARSDSNVSMHTVQMITPLQRSDSSPRTAFADSYAEPRTANSVQGGPVSVIMLSSSDDSDCDNAARFNVPPPVRSPSVISSFDCSTASSIGSLVALSDGEVNWYAGQHTLGSGSDVVSSPRARTIPPSPASSVDSGEWPARSGRAVPAARSKARSPSPAPRRPTRAAAATARARIAQMLYD
ncbi:hypothetical protein PRIPAC_91276 [Pristionchus pacificus]|nr:hypothetical protein PRIPAC_91276 [Pristionchus pacificus]